MKSRIWMIVIAGWPLAAAAMPELPKTAAEVVKMAEVPDAARKWGMAELERVLGAAEWKKWSTSGRGDFVRMLEAGWIEELMYSGPLPDDPAKMLRVAEALWKADREGWKSPHERTTAAAVALTYGQKNWPEDQALARYEYFRDSRKQGKLHPVFDGLATWEKRFVVSAGGNGGWAGKGGWGEDSLVWLRDHVKLPISEYTGACWQAPYRLENVFGDSIHGSRYYAPFEHQVHAERVRDVGGVCGSLSHYGATAARANGIPAITMGEPGHCAYAVRTARGTWTPAYSLSWQRGLHTSLWGRTWTQLVMQERVMGEKYPTDRATTLQYEARSLKEASPELAEEAYREALKAQPLAHPIWQEYVKFLAEKRSLDALGWKKVHDQALKDLADYPEALWEVVNPIEEKMAAMIPADEKIPLMLTFHEAICAHPGPVMWDVPKALEVQASRLGSAEEALEFFEQVVTLQAKSESWLAPVVAWGSERFGKGGQTEWFVALGRGLATGTGGEAGDSVRKALRPAILAAANSGNVDAFQALAKVVKEETKQTLKPAEPFAGELLSAGGLLKVSTTSRWDAPERHAAILEPGGGALHTDSEVRPSVVVRLAKLGDLSGIVVIDQAHGYNATRIVPIRISISEDGTSWQPVFRSEEPGKPWRVDLAGKATRVGWVKVERDDERKEVFHLSAIHVYGRRLQ